MFNLLKMEIHRLIHSMFAWVILLFTVAAAIFSIVMTNLDIQASKEEPPVGLVIEEQTDESQTGLEAGIYVTGNEEWADGKIELGDLISVEMQSGLMAILCVIFAALFANADQKNGFIKNIAGQFPWRGKLILSKFIAIAAWIFVLMAVFSVVIVTAGLLFWSDKVYLASMFPLVKLLSVQYLLHLGLAALTMFFTVLTRSTAFSMAAGIMICSGLTAIPYSGVNQLVSNVKPHWNFDINNYVMESNIRMIDVASAQEILVRAAVVGIVFVIFSIVLAMVTMKKRDI